MNKRSFKKILSLIIVFLFAIYYVYYSDGTVSDDLNKKNINYKETEDVVKINPDGSLQIQFIDVGQGDAILLSNNNEHMLIDAGNNEDGSKLVSYFTDLGITNFKFLVGTHAHEDHIGGMDDIIENFNVETFYMPDVITTTKTFEEVLDALAEKSVAFETPEIDSTFSFADCKFQVLYVGDDQKDLNDTSIVLKLIYGNNKFLFTGDATSKVEDKILDKDLSSDVLKVGHHGSSYSTTERFLKKVKPNYAIIQVGVGNNYNHPSNLTLTKFQNRGIKVYRTDEDGTIILTSDGNNISFTTKKDCYKWVGVIMRYVLDRIEGTIAILENLETKELIEVDRVLLPLNICDGSVIGMEAGQYFIEEDEEKVRKRRIREKLERLKRLKK